MDCSGAPGGDMPGADMGLTVQCSLALLLVPSGHSICTIFILVQFSIFGQLLTVLLILSLDNEL